jgi:hypothetical protein
MSRLKRRLRSCGNRFGLETLCPSNRERRLGVSETAFWFSETKKEKIKTKTYFCESLQGLLHFKNHTQPE